jgi:putative acetyltransferase
VSEPRLCRFAPDHGAAAIHVIRTVFVEYGMTFDLDGFDDDLRDVNAHYRGHAGEFWVLVHEGRVVGTIAVVPADASSCELKRLYLLREYRGSGHGRRLIEHVVSWASDRGYRTMVAWSDVRLDTAHRVYRRLGFEPIGERSCDDIDKSREHGFRLRLA